MAYFISSMFFILAQNAEEKSLTYLGVALFAGLIFFLIVDSTIKGNYVPKKGVVKKFLVFLFVLSIIILILLYIFYK